MVVEPSKANFSVKDGPITLVGRHFSVVSRPDLSDEEAYTFTKTLWEHDAELAPFHPGLKDWNKEHFASLRTPAPYHPAPSSSTGSWRLDAELEAHNQALIDAKAKK
jgi:TRAP-type uncharacterized transport system substrate-binding protein